MNRPRLGTVLSAYRRAGQTALLADIKCRSPRDGELIASSRLSAYVHTLLSSGIDALSVVTEPHRFGGSIEIAREVRRLANDVPLMRKEFFTSLEQVDESYAIGFDAIQLTLLTFDDLDLLRRLKERAERLGLEVILSVHEESELQCALDLGATTLIINNRDVSALELDDGSVSRTETLMTGIPDDVLVVSASGLLSPQDVARAARTGVDGVLVGTALARSRDPAEMVRALRTAAEKARA